LSITALQFCCGDVSRPLVSASVHLSVCMSPSSTFD